MRQLKWWWQRRTRGWDDRDLWSLDVALAKWILPRLKEFRKIKHGVPHFDGIDLDSDGNIKDFDLAQQQWQEIQGKMIIAFEHIIDQNNGTFLDMDDHEEIQEGLTLFGRYITYLWW